MAKVTSLLPVGAVGETVWWFHADKLERRVVVSCGLVRSLCDSEEKDLTLYKMDNRKELFICLMLLQLVQRRLCSSKCIQLSLGIRGFVT